jgi:hypothetical protein
MRILLGMLLTMPVWAAVNGVAVNGTSGQPQAGVAINLVQPGAGGMKALGQAVTNADGAFNIDAEIPPGPALLQSTYQGVTYTQALPPGTPTTGVRIGVYESTSKVPAEMIVEHFILLEPSASQLRVTETFAVRNQSKTAYQDAANGSMRMALPAGVPDNLEINIDSTGVPIKRPVEKTKQAGVYKVGYPIKPGETRFDLEYILPAAATFASRVLSNTPPVKLVTPAAVTLSGAGIKDLGQEPQTQARIYTFDGLAFSASILGVGAIRPLSEDVPQEETGAPKVEDVPARLQSQMPWVLGLGFGVLALGGTLLFRRGGV